MEIIGSGGANVLLRPVGIRKELYRCCVRYSSLKRNNELTIDNYRYIREVVAPLLAGLLAEMELVTLKLEEVGTVLRERVPDFDDSAVVAFKMLNLRPENVYGSVPKFDDHFTKVYCDDSHANIVLEIKPKWLHRDPEFCRNCTHNLMKGRNIPYCYSLVVKYPHQIVEILSFTGIDYPEAFTRTLESYFEQDNNVLRVLYSLQETLERETPLATVNTVNDVTNALLLNMTLRDVTCFIEWSILDPDTVKVNVVDVDKKPSVKWQHWVEVHKKLRSRVDKVNHG
ncbi:Inositol-pentakisphosphate 2-kinase [Nakaseomyces bracarensis]|uniref:Inositol-pentakisphosphate 2-kinase n=1 Tax=Nakaseomyces bracarensis TaxID=273131 RepID=A0ABR4NYG9_9SACH